MPKIAIIGLGLIGGSLGLALKRAALAGLEVAGYDRARDAGARAEKLGAVDRAARRPEEALEGAALVVIATPILQVRKVLEEIGPILGDGVVVTDTASTKRQVLRWADELLPDSVAFVGGHPVAGKETAGIEAADAALFEGRPWAVVPSVGAPERAIQTVENLIALAGARAVHIDAEEHDSYLAALSHLPLVLSTALFSLVSESKAWPELAALSGSGFRDLTRLASTSPDLSHDICLTNKENVLHWLDRFVEELRRYRHLIAEGGDEAIGERFFTVQAAREMFLTSPPRRAEPAVAGDTLSAGDRMLSFMVGEYLLRRRKEMEEMLERRPPRDEELRRKLEGP